jgi:hypothetical protein
MLQLSLQGVHFSLCVELKNKRKGKKNCSYKMLQKKDKSDYFSSISRSFQVVDELRVAEVC